VSWIRSRKLPLFERIPVRWRIAVTTAGLTLLILVCFALVLGQVVGNRIRGDFREELRSAARSLAAETRVQLDVVTVPSSPGAPTFEHLRCRRTLKSRCLINTGGPSVTLRQIPISI